MTLRRFLAITCLLGLSGCTSSIKTSQPEALGMLMVQRLNWMDEVARAKQARSLPITDAARESELLNAMEKLGAAAGLPAAMVRPYFAGQIKAAKQYQHEWLQDHPAAFSNSSVRPIPDLAKTVRPALDQIGMDMIAALAAARSQKTPTFILVKARRQLQRAGYSIAVTELAMQGLDAALKVSRQSMQGIESVVR